MDVNNEFIAQEKNLVFYAGKPIINKRHAFFDVNGDEWEFSGATGALFTIYQEREGGLTMIEWTTPDELAFSGNEIILNTEAWKTDIERGKYYYTIEYIIAGGYPILIGYGEAKFI